MIKAIIFDLEGVILNDELLRYKYYEILWYYLRRQPQWKDFNKLIRMREYIISQSGDKKAYLTIAKRYLTPREYENFRSEIKYFANRYDFHYLKTVPGMRNLVHTTDYYHQTVLYSHNFELLKKSLDQFWLKLYFSHDTLESAQKGASTYDMLRKILEDTRANPREAVFFSTHIQEIGVARGMGIRTILVRFDSRHRGIMPQSKQERAYFGSEDRLTGESRSKLFRHREAEKVVHNPEEISRYLQEAVSEIEQSSEKQAPEEKEVNIWNVFEEIFAPPLGNDRK
jgi:FMN phosphatase YigB (HAD superfamily)